MLTILAISAIMGCSFKQVIKLDRHPDKVKIENIINISYSKKDIPTLFMKFYKEINYFKFFIANPDQYYRKSDLRSSKTPNKQLIFHGDTGKENYYIIYYRVGNVETNVCYLLDKKIISGILYYHFLRFNSNVDDYNKFKAAFKNREYTIG